MFIKLTDFETEEPFYIRAESIEYIAVEENDTYCDDDYGYFTAIKTTNRTYAAKETPEEIIKRLDEAICR